MSQYYDLFTDTDGTDLAAHTADVSGGTTWIEIGAGPGTLAVYSNECRAVSGECSYQFPIAAGDTVTAIQWDLVATSTQSYICMHITDYNNWGAGVRWPNGGNKWTVAYRASGTITNFATDTTHTPVAADTIVLTETSTANYTVTQNGTTIMTGTSSSNNSSEANCGINGRESTALFILDSFYVTYTASGGGGTTVAINPTLAAMAMSANILGGVMASVGPTLGSVIASLGINVINNAAIASILGSMAMSAQVLTGTLAAATATLGPMVMSANVNVLSTTIEGSVSVVLAPMTTRLDILAAAEGSMAINLGPTSMNAGIYIPSSGHIAWLLIARKKRIR